LALLFIIILVSPIRTQTHIQFEHISVDRGLSQSTIQCVLQDSKGFIWICTEDGLNKYDGYNFEVYRPEPDNPHSISMNYTRVIIEDRQGFLWVGTLGGGLNKFDRKKGVFIRYQHNPLHPGSLSNDQVPSLLEDHTGTIWVGTYGGGLDRYNQKTNNFEHFQHDPKNPNSLSNNEVRTIYEDRAGILWIGTTTGGLNKFDPKKKKFTHYKAEEGKPGSLSHNHVLSIVEDKKGFLWIGTFGGGLNKFDPVSQTFTYYIANSNPGIPVGLNQNDVWAIVEDKSGKLWIGTRGGLNIVDPETGVFTSYKNDPGDPTSLSANEIRTIFLDNSGVIWIGTTFGGINKFDLEKQRFSHYLNMPNDPNSLSNNRALALLEDQKEDLWIGTYSGLDKLDRKTNHFSHYQNSTGDSYTLSNDRVKCLYEDKRGELWVGTLGGLNRYDRAKDRFIRHMMLGGLGDPLKEMIISLGEDLYGYLWVGTVRGIHVLDPDRKRSVHFEPNDKDPDSLSDKLVYCFLEDRFGKMWIGTHIGLNRYNREKNTFKHYAADPTKEGTISSNKINYIFQDKGGTLWVCTEGGLNRYDRANDKMKTYRIRDGLPSDLIFAVLEDEYNYLWISTGKGLSKFDPRREVFKNYDVKDGLQSNEFVVGSCWKSRKGELMFGGINGFNVFFPASIVDNKIIPKIVIRDFLIFNKSVRPGEMFDNKVILEKDISETQEIELSYKHTSFTFEFAGLHYAAPERNQYAYIMEGLEKSWNMVGNRRFATYAHMSPGQYMFRVKASNKDGIWNEKGASIRITIQPPPWKTWWAYTLYFLTFLAIILGYIRSQRKKLDYERSVNERLRQVDRLKDEFLANTSHELRTPLNGIIGIAESLVKGVTGTLPDITVANLRMVALSGKRLSSLVDDILDYSRLKEKDLHLQLSPLDMRSLTDVVLTLSRPLIVGKNLELRNEISPDTPFVYGDENRLQQIMHNLVGNAIKFTESGHVSLHSSQGNDKVIIMVKDTGIGIPKEKFEMIFQSFEQVDSSVDRVYGGTGLGLSITKKLIELHGGTIGVESSVGKGSTFWFSIPTWNKNIHPSIPGESLPSLSSPLPSESHILPDEFTSISPGHEIKTVEKNAPIALNTDREQYLILAVDDEIINLQVLVNHLSLHQYDVMTAQSGKEALDIVNDSPSRIDLVLLDVMMPRMSGYEVCRIIRSRYSASQLPIIMLTAKNQVSNLIEGLDSGANDYITKPFSSEELLERIKVHLQLMKANRELRDVNEKLEDYSRTLEQKVAERTRDLKEKNRLITDSMHFAQRIQHSILPLEEKIKAALPDHFIFYKPKDIVSGDFYWFEQVDQKIFIAAVDCTGHGVPGALMSMIGSMILNKLVQDQGIYDPALILENLHKELRVALKQKGLRHIDAAGMDVCLCMLDNDSSSDSKEKKLVFAGAHLSLFVVRSSPSFELEEIKGDPKPIGGLHMEVDRVFTRKEIRLNPGDLLYLSTDGFSDQHNNEGKKYGKRQLKKLFQGIARLLDMEVQRLKLEEEFSHHIGKEEQRDDITIIAIKI